MSSKGLPSLSKRNLRKCAAEAKDPQSMTQPDASPAKRRRWPGVTLHDPEIVERVDAWLAEGGY